VAANLAAQFHKRNTSAQPYVCFVGIDAVRESRLKQRLWDKGIRFHDGSHFDGDKFRLDDLLAADLGNASVTVKVVPSSRLDELVESKQMDEVFEFRLADAAAPQDSKALPGAKLFYLEQTRDVITLTK